MNRYTIFTFVFLAFSFSITAQTETSTAPVNWERYKISNRNISIMIPKMPTVIDGRNLCSELEKVSYYAYADQSVYELIVAEKSKIKIPKYCSVKKNFGDTTFGERLAEIRSDPNTNQETSLFQDGRQIYKFVNKFAAQWVIPDLKNGRWVELAIHRREYTKSEDDRFISSLDMASSEGKEIGEGARSTLGDAGVQIGIPPEHKEKPVEEGVMIVAKPRASYTDSARKSNVQGSVLLKVTLLASGGVGSITPIKELPEGLTEQAISAARKLVFLPKRVGGAPVTVILTFDYGFSIY